MKTVAYSVSLLVALSGCAGMTNAYMGVSHFPGKGFNARAAQQYGCNAEEVSAAAKENRGVGGLGGSKMPEVGWTACDIFARTGVATRVTRQQSTAGRSEIWYYEGLSGNDVVMVTLQPQGDVWSVTSVNTSGS
jgi:hypothetical protein